MSTKLNNENRHIPRFGTHKTLKLHLTCIKMCKNIVLCNIKPSGIHNYCPLRQIAINISKMVRICFHFHIPELIFWLLLCQILSKCQPNIHNFHPTLLCYKALYSTKSNMSGFFTQALCRFWSKIAFGLILLSVLSNFIKSVYHMNLPFNVVYLCNQGVGVLLPFLHHFLLFFKTNWRFTICVLQVFDIL